MLIQAEGQTIPWTPNKQLENKRRWPRTTSLMVTIFQLGKHLRATYVRPINNLQFINLYLAAASICQATHMRNSGFIRSAVKILMRFVGQCHGGASYFTRPLHCPLPRSWPHVTLLLTLSPFVRRQIHSLDAITLTPR